MVRARTVLALAAVVLVSVAAVPSVWSEEWEPYIHPVDAPITDTFRPPPQPWAPGNRGIDYATTPGTPVRAAGAGEVVFAGQVGGALFVVVLHDDGLRTTYAFLQALSVARGVRVARGATVGVAAGSLHFGVRIGEEYVDPLGVIGAELRLRLVPHERRIRAGPASEVPGLQQLVVEEGGGGVVEGIRAGVAWLRGAAGSAVGVMAWSVDAVTGAGTAAVTGGLRRLAATADLLHDLHPLVTLSALAGAALTWSRQQGSCTPPEAPVAPVGERRIALLVGGLGSSSAPGDAAITALDVTALGYAGVDVVQFSYAGGRVPDPGDALAAVPANPYTAEHSQADLWLAAARFRDLLVMVAAAAPGVPVDVFAHSQGGVVARLGIGMLATGDASARPTTLVTFGTPHQGAPLAGGLDLVDRTAGGRIVLEGLQRVPGLPAIDRTSPAVAQLEPGSHLLQELARQGAPEGVRTVSIAARGDPTVPAGHSRLTGAVNVVVSLDLPDAHDALPGSPEALREAALALNGRPPTCRTLLAHLADTVLSRHWASMESLAALGLASLGTLAGPAPVAPTQEPAVPRVTQRTGSGRRRRGRPDRRLGYTCSWPGDRRAFPSPNPSVSPRSPPRGVRRSGSQPLGGTRGTRRHHEAAARGRRPLRSPDPPVEPEDAPVHLRRAQRHLHHRSPADAHADRGGLLVRPRHDRRRRHRAVRRHQEAGPGPDP